MQEPKHIHREEKFREIERDLGRRDEKFQQEHTCEEFERLAQDIHSGVEPTEEKLVNIICLAFKLLNKLCGVHLYSSCWENGFLNTCSLCHSRKMPIFM